MSASRISVVCLAVALSLSSAAVGPALAACDPPPSFQEYVVNGKFNEGLDHWWALASGTAGTIAMGSGESEGMAVLTVTEPDPANPWKVMINQQAQALENMPSDRNYQLQLLARAVDQPHPLHIALRILDAHGQLAWLPLATLTIPVTAAPQLYSVTFHLPGWVTAGTPPLNSNTWRELSFSAAAGAGTLWLDEIHVNEMTEACFNNNQLVLSPFLAGEVWQSSYLGISPVASGGMLPLSIPANDRVFLSRVLPFDASSGDFDVELTLSTTTPQNVGRMYAALRWEDAASDTDYFVYRPFSGLKPGVNTILLHHTSNSMTDGFPQQYLSPPVGFDRMHTVGLKVEANGNGPVDMALLSLRIVPLTSPGPLSLTRLSVIQVTSTSALVRWQLDRRGFCSVRYGTTPGYGSLAEAGYSTFGDNRCAVTLSGLTPSTQYHLQAVAVDDALVEGVSGDMALTTEPPAGSPWVPGAGSTNLEIGVGSLIDSRDVEEAAGAGFNRVVGFLAFQLCGGYPDFSNDLTFQNAAAGFLSACAGQGVKTLMLPYCTSSIFLGIDTPPSVNLSHVASRVSFLKNFSALQGYYPWDEPEFTCLVYPQGPQRTLCEQQLHDRLLQVHQQRIAVDANHLDFVASTQAGASLPYNDSHDRTLLDDYPIPEHPADYIICSLEKAQAYGRPFDFVVQSYQGDQNRFWSGDWPMPTRFPTVAEMRSIDYLALAHGAKTIWSYGLVETLPPMRDPLYWSPESRAGSEGQWTALASLAQELRRIGPAIAGGTLPTESITVQNVVSCQTVEMIKRTLGNYTYIVAINRRTYDSSCHQVPSQCQNHLQPVGTGATIKLTGSFIGPVDVLGESRQLPLSGKSFSDTFAPLGVHIYRIRRN